ncbi:hypothetical protein AC579_8481 [Pseudocercospora musae]|uniref:GTPase-activating protein GYP7 n=1 Tax=Pseudocercospora musae TaxID=113226 RepID=A0A139I0R4_9PEZI|nr:hypothetical protein AC579_8481 [Pseudocercospora musae]
MPSTPPLAATDAAANPPSPPSPPSPSASFYLSDDEMESEYNTVRHSKSEKGVKLLYCKSKVYIHPTPSAKDNVPGWIALVQQKPDLEARPTSFGGSSAKPRSRSDLLLAWVPESSVGDAIEKYTKVEMALADSDSPPKQSSLVPRPPVVTTHSSTLCTHAFAVQVSDIFSITVRPPSTGWWFGSIIINSKAGDGFPALFFHDSECQSTIAQRKKLQREDFSISGSDGHMFWGGGQVMEWLKKHVNVERSTQEPNIYLIDPSDDDKFNFGSGGKPTPDKVKNVLEGKHKDEPSHTKNKSNGETAIAAVLKQARWGFLESMAKVTTFTRRTAQSVAENKNLPPQFRRLMQNPQIQTVADEFDSARLYLARWAMSIAEQSDRERNQRIWTAKDVLEMEDGELGEFELLDAQEGLALADKRKPVDRDEWNSWFNFRTGRLEKTSEEVKERIFHGGLAENDGVRKEAWLFLLGVYEWDSTSEDRHAKMNSLRDEYIRLKASWWERLVDESGTLEEREWWKEQKMRIGKPDSYLTANIAAADQYTDRAIRGAVEKDVHRTDRHLPLFAGEDIPHPDPDSPFAESGTNVHLEQMKDMLLTYNEYNRDLGYVQGMSDLLAPIYAIEQDDAIAFWGFVKFMERMERNFLRDQSGMRLQLSTLDQLIQLIDPKLYEHLARVDSTNFFFFFRMLLVWFKREFEFEPICRLWEGLWTDYLSSNFHLFIAAAILEKHRNVIMEHLKGFDEVLKYINELSGTIDLYSTLVRAESLFKRYRRMVEAIDRKNNFPQGPEIRQRVALPQPPSPTISRPGSDGRPRRTSSSAAESSSRQQTPAQQAAARREAEEAVQKENIITPELRSLLSREPPKLEKEEVRSHGGGIGS